MLALWKEWGVDKILQKALKKGAVLGGISAGMNCWYEECVTDSFYGELTELKGLVHCKQSPYPSNFAKVPGVEGSKVIPYVDIGSL